MADSYAELGKPVTWVVAPCCYGEEAYLKTVKQLSRKSLMKLISVVSAVFLEIFVLLSKIMGHDVMGKKSLMVSLGVMGEDVGRTNLESKYMSQNVISEVLD